MHAVVQAFKLVKAGNEPLDYEDAYWPPDPIDGDRQGLRLAVADGATEASFSGVWANLLVRGFGRRAIDTDSFEERLADLQQRWLRYVGNKPLPWYAEEKLRSGAFAAVAGLYVTPPRPGDRSGRWDAIAVGDSCLFHTRGETLLSSFPLERSEAFNSRPLLVSSIPVGNRGLREAVRRLSGDWQGGDTFYLMTDALACWFLRSWELRADPLGFLRSVASPSDFEQFITRQREDKAEDDTPMLRNDDVTMVRCTVSAG